MRAARLAKWLTPITPGARRSVVTLFALTLALAGANLLFTTWQVTSTGHKFCQVVSSVTAVPVQAPPDPRSNPSREKQYELYREFVWLGRSLGC